MQKIILRTFTPQTKLTQNGQRPKCKCKNYRSIRVERAISVNYCDLGLVSLFLYDIKEQTTK